MILLTKAKMFVLQHLIKIISVIAIVGILYLGVTYTLNKIDNLETKVDTQEATIQNLNAQLAFERKTRETVEKETNDLTRRFDKSLEYQNELIRKLQRHDLTRLALSKPNLIEKRMNDGTKDVFDEIERITDTDNNP